METNTVKKELNTEKHRTKISDFYGNLLPKKETNTEKKTLNKRKLTLKFFKLNLYIPEDTAFSTGGAHFF